MKRTLGLIAVIVSIVLGASTGNAATLNVVGGQLLGASGVDVNGSLYDVEFFLGTCAVLYGGCDEVSDFTFQTLAAAALASQALLDQVFLDGAILFDTQPFLTNGCTHPDQCGARMPYAIHPTSSQFFLYHGAFNRSPSFGPDFLSSNPMGIIQEVGDSANVFAVWTPATAPEPVPLAGPLAMAVLCGLLGVTGRRCLRA